MNRRKGKISLELLSVAVIAGLVFTTGCAPPPKAFIIKHYQEEARSLEEVGLVMTVFGHQNGTIKITSISEGIGMDGGNRIFHPYVLLEPGQYTFDLDCSVIQPTTVVVVNDTVYVSTGQSEIIGIPFSQTMDVKAGHVYYLTGIINQRDERWHAIVNEIVSHAIAESGNKALINGYDFVKMNYQNATTYDMSAR